jgi:hypothetical protein
MRWVCTAFGLLIGALLIASTAWSQQPIGTIFSEFPALGPGWQGFTDFAFLGNTLLTLTLAAILGGVISFHPRNREAMALTEGVNSPKVYVMYPVIGAIVGILVVNYGMAVGFVLFGIGGLMRFRTVLRSPSLTGRIIFATLIGLSCGLDLPHVAVLATLFGILIIYLLDARVTYRIDIKGLPSERIGEAVMAYRAVLEQQGCVVLSERGNCEKSRVTLVLRCPRHSSRMNLEKLFKSNIDESLAGSVSWRFS